MRTIVRVPMSSVCFIFGAKHLVGIIIYYFVYRYKLLWVSVVQDVPHVCYVHVGLCIMDCVCLSVILFAHVCIHGRILGLLFLSVFSWITFYRAIVSLCKKRVFDLKGNPVSVYMHSVCNDHYLTSILEILSRWLNLMKTMTQISKSVTTSTSCFCNELQFMQLRPQQNFIKGQK